MIRLFAAILAVTMLAGCSVPKEPPRQIPIARANVLPLALSDDFEFRKVTKFVSDPRYQRQTQNQMLLFERQRAYLGAVTANDVTERMGYYFIAWWRSKRVADASLRLEYRQENLGSYVQAKELHYRGVKGTIESRFNLTGDESLENGKVTAWRLLLIENGKIVGLKQSFLWN